MNCPKCGHNHTKVIRTTKVSVSGDCHIKRERRCLSCKARFDTFECYEQSDVEAAFDLAEIQAVCVKVATWIEPAARNIPIVRDARKLLLQHSAISSNIAP